MQVKSLAFVLMFAGANFCMLIERANAFCGVVEETRAGRTVDIAKQNAKNAALRKLSPLKRKHGKKLVKSNAQLTCIGGALSIDSNGNQVEGKPSCTFTQPFCVNP